MLLNDSKTPFFISKLNVVIRENINNNNKNGEKNNRKGLRKISGQILFRGITNRKKWINLLIEKFTLISRCFHGILPNNDIDFLTEELFDNLINLEWLWFNMSLSLFVSAISKTSTRLPFLFHCGKSGTQT